MPTGMRSSFIALALCSLMGAAQAAGPASTWSDPPPRRPDADKAAAPAPKPSTPAAVATEQPSRPPAGMAVSRPARMATRRTPPKARIATRTPPRHRHIAVTRHPAVPSRMASVRPPFVAQAYPAHRAVDYPLDYEDARLERLSSAVHSGYLVMRRRTVEYPDGRVIRIYRPVEEGDGD